MAKTYRTNFLVFAFLVLTQHGASAQHASIAYSSDKAWGWANATTQAEARRLALEQCEKSSKTKDCKIDEVKAVARAESAGRTGYAKSKISLRDAQKTALNSCADKDCKITFKLTSPGFFALAKSESNIDGNAIYHLAHQFYNSDEADKKAIERCQEESNSKCFIVWSSAIPGKMNSSKGAAVTTKNDPENCRPTKQPITCSSHCINGLCTVSYENGCKIKVQVAPKFDPFTNTWKYPSPSC